MLENYRKYIRLKKSKNRPLQNQDVNLVNCKSCESESKIFSNMILEFINRRIECILMFIYT